MYMIPSEFIMCFAQLPPWNSIHVLMQRRVIGYKWYHSVSKPFCQILSKGDDIGALKGFHTR